MHDLRRQALESGKTVSKKARSKQASGANSRTNSAANSRVGSKNGSRAASDDEEGGNLSDETSFRYARARAANQNTLQLSLHLYVFANLSYSVNSIDEIVAGDDSEQVTDSWRTELGDRIEEIIDRKRSSVQGREATLAAYIRLLTAAYAEEEIRGKEADLLTALLKSIKAETSEKETILAMKGTSIFIAQHDIQLTWPCSTCHDAYHITIGCHLRRRLPASQTHHLGLGIHRHQIRRYSHPRYLHLLRRRLRR